PMPGSRTRRPSSTPTHAGIGGTSASHHWRSHQSSSVSRRFSFGAKRLTSVTPPTSRMMSDQKISASSGVTGGETGNSGARRRAAGWVQGLALGRTCQLGQGTINPKYKGAEYQARNYDPNVLVFHHYGRRSGDISAAPSAYCIRARCSLLKADADPS